MLTNWTVIEMFADDTSVLLSDPSVGISSTQQRSELSGTCAENLNQAISDPKEDTVTLSEPRWLHTQSQNGLQHPKPHQQRLNKRRNTMSSVKNSVFGKRRRRTNSESESVLPSNFLMGGNIFDPLNLNSLLDEEVNRALNAETPKSSPLPSRSRDPVEILIPRDITDPLNLNGCQTGDAGVLLTPLRSGRRRHRNRHHGGAGGRAGFSKDPPRANREGDPMSIQLDPPELKSQPDSTETSLNTHMVEGDLDPELPVVDEPEPTLPPRQEEFQEQKESMAVCNTQSAPAHALHRQRKRRRSRSENTGAPWDKNKTAGLTSGSGQYHHPNNRGQPKNCQKQNIHKKKFQYGNYNQYYGYRNPGASEDSRIRILQPDWFRGKEVLDLGCNTGHLTLTIAKNWQPARIVGLDIDGSLIHAARQNIRHYLSEIHTLQARGRERDSKSSDNDSNERELKKHEHKTTDANENVTEIENQRDGAGSVSSNGSSVFPVSMLISRGPIAAPPLPDTPRLAPGNFPSNITFVKVRTRRLKMFKTNYHLHGL